MKRRTLLSLLPLIALPTASNAKADPLPVASPYAVSDSDLFAMLDLRAVPSLSPVETAWKTGDLAAAKKALAAYLRGRTSVPWSLSPTVPDRTAIKWNPKAAEAARNGTVTVVTIPHTFPDARLIWDYNATGGTTGLPVNSEWTWQLNRMEWWRDLIAAYRATGDESWARLYADQFRSWIAQCPPPPKVANGNGSAWRTIECGIRASGILADSYQAFLLSPSLSDDDLLAFVRVLVEHGRYLSACHTGGNWLTMEMNGLHSVGCLFPELKTASEWRKQAADALYQEQSVQFLPDGAQFELTPGYHNVALDNVLGLYQRAKMTGQLKEIPSAYVAGMERAFAFDMYMLTPDRGLPKFNDSWSYNMTRKIATAAEMFPTRTDFAWIGSDGKAGKVPTETSHFFPWAGYCVMRGGWERDACMGILDAGPLGNGHFHQDKLNFVAWAYGRELLFDSGGGSYEKSRYRAYATDTFGHNCVLVDGKPQRRDAAVLSDRVAQSPIDARWTSTPTCDYAEGIYNEGWGTVADRVATHKRRVLFVKGTPQNPPFWIVSDLMTPGDDREHSYQARWNLLTTTTMGGNAQIPLLQTADKDQPNLVILPLLTEGIDVRTASAQLEPEVLGWNVRKDTDPQYVPATTVLHTVKGTGERRFLTLLLPLKRDEENPVASISAGGKITFKDGSLWTVEDRGAGGLSVRITAKGQERSKEIISGVA